MLWRVAELTYFTSNSYTVYSLFRCVILHELLGFAVDTVETQYS